MPEPPSPRNIRRSAGSRATRAGRIRGASTTVTIALAHKDGTASIAVKDEGEGIDPDRLARVFERFERGVRGGAGLGLALVKEIVELHGGWVDLESEPERGTTVVVHLPEEAAETHAAPELDLKGRIKGEAKAG